MPFSTRTSPSLTKSIPMVLFALVSDASIGYLFLGGAVPGLIMAAALMAINRVMAHRRGFPVEEEVRLRALPGITVRAFPALMMPVVLLGGIYGGVMTPTEAAGVAVIYAIPVGFFVYRGLDRANFWEVLRESSITIGVVLIAVALGLREAAVVLIAIPVTLALTLFVWILLMNTLKILPVDYFPALFARLGVDERALLAVDFAGLPCDWERLGKLAVAGVGLCGVAKGLFGRLFGGRPAVVPGGMSKNVN